MSSSKTPCAACKLQRRKCMPDCVFAPYFPPDIPQKFQNVHIVFGASNVSKILLDLDVAQREEAVRSLSYEADTRIQDPVYGCVGHIAYLQKKLRYLINEIDKANKEIALYEGNHGFQPFLVPGLDAHHAGPSSNIVFGQASSIYPYNNMPPQTMVAARGGGNLVIRDPQQQLVAGDIDLRQVQELYGIYDQHQQLPPPQKDFISYGGGGSVSGSGFNQAPEISASLALNTFDNSYQSVQVQGGQGRDCHQTQQNQHHNHHNLQEQLSRLQHQSQPLHHQPQEPLLLSSQQPQQLQPQPQHHHHFQKQMLLQPQPQHQEQSRDKDGT